MLNFKFIRLGWLFVLAFVLFFHNVSFAQERQTGIGSLRSLNIKDVKIETSDTEIKISGKLINQSQNIATGKITHLLVLETIDPLIKPKNEIDQMPPLIVLADEGKDYFSLGPDRQKSFSYSLSASKYVPNANYRLSLSFIRSDGKEEARYSEVVINFGSAKKEGFLAFDQQSCVLFNKEGKRLSNNNGPAFLPGESPKISCLIKNIGDKEIEVSPKILWKEVFVYGKPLEGKMAEEKQSEKIFFNPGESKTIALFMPIAEKPQTYQGLLSFEDENGTSRSFNTFFRWTISGESARVKSVAQTSQLKDFYDKGDVVALSVDYFGSSDLYWAGTQAVSNLSDLTMSAVIKDKNGNICGEKEETLPEITDGFSKNKTVEIVLDKKCKGMTYSVSLSSGQKSLTEQSGDLPKFVNRQNTLQYFYFGAPAIMILLAFYLFIRKKSVPVYFFIFAFAGVAMFSVSVLAETKTFPASGGSVSSWEWGGDWINDGSAVLYSTSFGTGGINTLKPNYVSTQLAGFFVNNTGLGDIVIEYVANDTPCSNTSMEVEYEVYMGANGEESFLTKAHIEYNNSVTTEMQRVPIPADKISWLYEEDGIPKADPKLIVRMKQIGMYGDQEFNYEYKWVGVGLGSYGYNYETESYYPEFGGDYNLVITANDTFYPGLFTSGTSDKTTKANAYAQSDTIRIEIPLLLPTPTLRLKPLSATINPGQAKQFSVFYDADGPSLGFPEENVTAKIGARGIDNWSSDDATVVKVNETGLATAVASGSTKIKAIYYRGLKAKAQISIPSLRIRPTNAEITKGDGRQFKSVYDEDGWGEVFGEKEVTGQSVWISDNPDSATVENKKNILSGKGKGWVSALKEGSANISADYSGLRAVSYVSVKNVPIPLKVSCVADPNPVLVNEQTTTFTADATGGTAPYSYGWTGDDGLSGSGETISKSYSTAETKNATVEVKDKVGAIASNTCSVEAKDGTIGECSTVKDQCLVGVPDDIADSTTQYLWNCDGTKSTDYCSLDKPTNDPSYNVSPDNTSAYVKQSFQFSGIYDSDKTDTSNAIADVTKLAKWEIAETSDTSVATIIYEGADAGLATCEKAGKITIKSTYINAEDQTLTSEAVLNCTPTDPPNYTLTVNIVGQGAVDGLIGICKQAKCEKTLESGTAGYLRATPDAGYSFSLSKWSGLCSQAIGNVFVSDGNDDYSEDDYICDPLTITSNKEVTVVFEEEPTYEISPSVAKTEVGKTVHFSGLWSDGERYQQDKTNMAVWEVIDKDGDDDDSIATFKSMWLEKGEAKCVSAGTAYVYSSYGGLSDKVELICDDEIVVPDHTLTVAKTGAGYGEITGAVRCDIDCDSASKDYSEGSVVKITAMPVEGSSFNGWSGDCSGKDPVCELTMLEDKDASALFTKNTNPSPKAYISADNTSVDSGGFTKVIWKSDNAVKCVGEYGGFDADWVGERGIDGFHQTKSFQSEEERVYGVTCYDKFDDYDSASIDISAGGIDIPTPFVDLIADPDEVEIDGKSKLSWLSSNTKSCEIISDDDKTNFGNNLDSTGFKDTGVLDIAPKEYSYTIKCEGDDGSFVEDEVVIETKPKICVDCVEEGEITINISDKITATIVAGLTTKTQTEELEVRGPCADDSLSLSAEYSGKKAGGNFVFDPKNDGSIPYNGNFSVKNIKGTTDAGIYPITLTATCKDDNDKSISAIKTINLVIKKILSDWQEI